MTEPFIEATHVGKIYGDGSTRLVVLKDINLALDGGKLTVLMGPSGGAVAELVGIEGGVVSGVINLESSDVEASDWRPRHDKPYHEA